MRSRTTGGAVALTSALVLVAGCSLLGSGSGGGPGGPGGGGGEREAGEVVARWSEATEDWVAEVRDVPTVLIQDDAGLQAWVDTLPADAEDSLHGVRAVDLEESVLVVGAFHRCTEESRVLLAAGQDGPTLRFDVTQDDEGVVCVWAPLTIDAYAIPLAETNGVVPVLAPEDGAAGDAADPAAGRSARA